MKLRRKKLIMVLSAGVMAVTLMFGTPSAAFADNNSKDGTQAAPANVAITKNLQMDENAETPNATFTFEFTPISVDGVTTVKPPAIGVKTATIVAGATATPVSGIKTVTATTADILDTSTTSTTYPHAGVYVYEVTEKDEKASNAAFEYSKAKYTMTVYVANGANDGELYIASVGVVETTKNDGTTGSGSKVDLTDNSGETGTGTKFAFKNTYTPLAPLEIKKLVANTYADQTKAFDFKTQLTFPSTANKADSYTAYIYDKKDDQKVAGLEAVTFSKDNDNYTTAYQLKHGQYLKFEDSKGNNILPVGTTYTVAETVETDYTISSQTKNVNGTLVNDGVTGGTVDATNLIVYDRGADPDADSNLTTVTNTYKTITPTGILINNLPYILMIAAAMLGFVMYVRSKRRHVVR